MSTKTTIFEAAIKLFAEKGYDITIVEDILKKAEVSRRTFYKYYRSKRDILIQLKEEKTEISKAPRIYKQLLVANAYSKSSEFKPQS